MGKNKIERQYLAHYLDENFGKETASYCRLGDDLEEYNEELNAEVEVKKNIKGEQTVNHTGYSAQSEVDPYYAERESKLGEKLLEIANERLTGIDCYTTIVDALFDKDGTCKWAYKEDVMVVPNSVGGDTSGVQIPFTVYYSGNRTKGKMDFKTNTFTPDDTE